VERNPSDAGATIWRTTGLATKTVIESPRLAAYAIPWPKLPAVEHTKSGLPTTDETRYSAPRPLKERIGFSVSTLTTTRHPSRLPSDSAKLQRVEKHRINNCRGVRDTLRRDSTIVSHVHFGYREELFHHKAHSLYRARPW
jgi:hypothetical protein